MIDFSTLNEKRIKLLRPYVKPASYEVSDSMGSGCAGDPPGYPTYFIRSIYNRFGNSPDKDATEVIQYEDQLYCIPDFWKNSKTHEEYAAKRDRFFKRLYVPLQEDHPRVQAWIANQYRHMQHCYYDPSRLTSKYSDTMIYPVPRYAYKTCRIDFRWEIEYIFAVMTETLAYNRMILAHAKEVATADNHQAVRKIREFYPDHINLTYIVDPPKTVDSWWEVLAEKPTPENCPGEIRWSKKAGYNTAHPVNGSWCQVCGNKS